MLLAILSILPAIFFIFYLNGNERKIRDKQQIENLNNLTKLYAEGHYQVIENAKHLLIALSVAPQIQNTNKNVCNKFLSDVQNKYLRYSNFGVTDQNGNVICSAVSPVDQKINISDTIFFKETINTNDFAIGGYRISDITNNAVLSFGYPLNNGIIYSSIDLSWLNRLTANLSTSEAITTTVLDTNGRIISQNPDTEKLSGKEFPSSELLKNIREKNEGVVEDIDIHNFKKLYAFKKIGDQQNSPYIILDVSKESALNETAKIFFKRILLSIIVGLACLVFAWWAGGILIVKQIEELKKIDNLKDDFISLVSHQIRTPLTGIRWLSEIMLSQKQYDLSRKSKNIIKDIYEVSGNVISLVGTFLNISKIESGKIKLNAEAVNIKELINEVVNELKVNIKDKKINLKFKTNQNLKADRKLLKQAYINLISNAIKYSKSKGIITVNVYKSDTSVVTEVKDNGIGILAEDKDKIFQKFFRTRSATEHNPDGAGLGAYLVKIIVEAHGGKIWFNSKKNKGSTFYISLPAN